MQLMINTCIWISQLWTQWFSIFRVLPLVEYILATVIVTHQGRQSHQTVVEVEVRTIIPALLTLQVNVLSLSGFSIHFHLFQIIAYELTLKSANCYFMCNISYSCRLKWLIMLCSLFCRWFQIIWFLQYAIYASHFLHFITAKERQ